MDTNHKINDQKISNFFVSLFTAIGTIATIFYSIKQYKLSELVNRTSIKPDIYPKSYFLRMEDDEEPIDIAGIEPNLYLTHGTAFAHDHKLMIKNIGVGIAKNIKIKWLYDKVEVESLIRGKYYLTPNDKQNVIQYLNPNMETDIKLPHEYLSCCGNKLFNKFDTEYFSNKETFTVEPSSEPTKTIFKNWKKQTYPQKRPDLKLEIKYSDAQNFEYTKTFDTEVKGLHEVVMLDFT